MQELIECCGPFNSRVLDLTSKINIWENFTLIKIINRRVAIYNRLPSHQQALKPKQT
jgi:hypothetical protein